MRIAKPTYNPIALGTVALKVKALMEAAASGVELDAAMKAADQQDIKPFEMGQLKFVYRREQGRLNEAS